MRLVATWGCHGNIHAHLGCSKQQGREHVVAISNPRQFEAAQDALFLQHGHEIGQTLGRVRVIREAVDDRNSRMLCQSHHIGVREDARHDAVYIATQDACHISDAFSLAKLDLVWREVHCMPAQMLHGHLKGHPGPERGLLEDHAEGLAH